MDEDWLHKQSYLELDSQEDAREILTLLDAQEDYFVVHLRRFTFGVEFSGLFPEDSCAECECDLINGAEVLMWGEPADSSTPAAAKESRFAALRFFCCEEHAEAYTDRWVTEIGFEEYATAFHS